MVVDDYYWIQVVGLKSFEGGAYTILLDHVLVSPTDADVILTGSTNEASREIVLGSATLLLVQNGR